MYPTLSYKFAFSEIAHNCTQNLFSTLFVAACLILIQHETNRNNNKWWNWCEFVSLTLTWVAVTRSLVFDARTSGRDNPFGSVRYTERSLPTAASSCWGMAGRGGVVLAPLPHIIPADSRSQTEASQSDPLPSVHLSGQRQTDMKDRRLKDVLETKAMGAHNYKHFWKYVFSVFLKHHYSDLCKENPFEDTKTNKLTCLKICVYNGLPFQQISFNMIHNYVTAH
jgi:hypothetical protein